MELNIEPKNMSGIEKIMDLSPGDSVQIRKTINGQNEAILNYTVPEGTTECDMMITIKIRESR